MQSRALLVAFALFGAGCSSVSESAAALPAPPQPPLPQFFLRPAWEFAIEQENDLDVAAHVSDLDADGFDEVSLLVGSVFEPDGARVWLLSGRDGLPRHGAAHVLDFNERRACHPQNGVSTLMDVGDTNGDGVTDFAVGVCSDLLFGRFEPTGVWLFSSDTWRPLGHRCSSKESFGRCIAPVGDVDGDGRSDFAVTNDYGPASVEVLSLSGHTSLWVKSLWLKKLPHESGFIVDLIAIGDGDGDGLNELAVRVGGKWLSPTTLFVLAGRDGSVLWSRAGVLPGEWDFVNVAGAGDVDSDGVPDLWAVIHEPDLDRTRVELLSGRDGATLRSAGRSQYRGFEIEACADLDGDGVSELVVPWFCEGEESAGAIEVISSRTLTSLCYSPCEDGLSVAALRTPHGLRIVTHGQSGLQAFDLVPKDGAGER
ncbi:MAG: VCBS repeat-containing protein [Planctomycetes bacterium]|nr:VCBS repeat-containing protein [Planctomycetota bacterium]